ncbi:RepB family plasmid replication initiator protein (plasmid) [Candidatus Pantoea edessiphila]|uniref:RepB family plasmid replication initiator protein n=1 Tax=Candidatus Pantoea edessiphila TaxID=2044610 RepID=A0A2P5SXB2_9GAMM|nr:replication initiator protein A [Candidatus Pantoea edessiphila]MBK4775937.1 replication initiator protein A [Pantoea sp. Edef]PPI86942.1 RepB family plasmid replication initiator protein [Candidatus Pantoea edessiphila]
MNTLNPRKYELDFFITDEIKISSFRDEIASMEHPFFALKGGNTKIREYKNGNITVIVKPTADGLATIFDKDVWIYVISKLQESMNINKEISRTVCFTPYDFFIATNRTISGRTYQELEKALDRLQGTTIKTNISYSKKKQEIIGFGLIDSWQILEEKKGKLDIGMVKVTLPNWLYQALYKKKILKISPDYFRIRKAIDRRIYEIARKHCGTQREFVIALDKLHLKTGSTALLKMFRYNIKQLARKNDLPDYEIRYNPKGDMVIFDNRNNKLRISDYASKPKKIKNNYFLKS